MCTTATLFGWKERDICEVHTYSTHHHITSHHENAHLIVIDGSELGPKEGLSQPAPSKLENVIS